VTLQQIVLFSQIAAAIGVIASLVFVGLQVRGSARAVRSATAQAVHDNFSDWHLRLAESPDALAIALRGFESLGSLAPAERALFNCIFLACTLHSQNAFHQWRQGHLATELWDCWAFLLANMVHTDGGLKFWSERRYMFSQAFQSEVDGIARREPHANAKSFGVLKLIRACH
jgi:hypothetical protein